MRNLSSKEIDAILAKPKYAKARRIAVANFLLTLGGQSDMGAAINLGSDTRDYGWKAPTVNAIKEGMQLARRPAPVETPAESQDAR